MPDTGGSVAIDLRNYILTVDDFPTAGVKFKDITPLLAAPEALQHCVDAFVEAFADAGVQKVAAFDARGFLFGAPVALRLRVPFVPIRKRGKLPRGVHRDSYAGEYGEEVVEMHLDAISPGERVLIVDDVIAFGEGMSCGCRMVESLGGEVAGCATVIQFLGLGAPARLEGRRVVSLVQY